MNSWVRITCDNMLIFFKKVWWKLKDKESMTCEDIKWQPMYLWCIISFRIPKHELAERPAKDSGSLMCSRPNKLQALVWCRCDGEQANYHQVHHRETCTWLHETTFNSSYCYVVEVTFSSRSIQAWRSRPKSMKVHSIPSRLYSSCSRINIWWLKNCCNFSFVKLIHSCSKLLNWGQGKGLHISNG